jgi:hypothetical protein
MVAPGVRGDTYNGVPVSQLRAAPQPVSAGTLSNSIPMPKGWGTTAATVMDGVKGDTFNGISTAKAVAQQQGVNTAPFTNLLPKNWGGTGQVPGIGR